jgi:protein-tyrosine-phosphatase
MSQSKSSSLSLFEDSLEEFHRTQSELDSKLVSSERKLHAEFQSLDLITKDLNKQQEEWSKLHNILMDLRRDGNISDQLFSDYKLKLTVCSEYLNRLKSLKPKSTNSLFVRLMMGKISTIQWKTSDKLQFKDEYNKFKYRTTFIFILFPLVQLLLMYFSDKTSNPYVEIGSLRYIIFQIHAIWLIYYYLTLSLRENILQSNGSNIHNWWISHHHITMTINILMVIYPNQFLYDNSTWFLSFALFQGLIMAVQNNYQSKRNYVRKTLGKAKQFDVDSSETLVEKPADLKILIPLLYALYCAEFYWGIHSILAFYYNRTLWPVLIIGVLFLVLGLGNSFTTAKVLVSKNNLRKLRKLLKMKRTHSAEGEKKKQ